MLWVDSEEPKSYCPLCVQELPNPNVVTCPFCGAQLREASPEIQPAA
jgi:hypothetical protein